MGVRPCVLSAQATDANCVLCSCWQHSLERIGTFGPALFICETQSFGVHHKRLVTMCICETQSFVVYHKRLVTMCCASGWQHSLERIGTFGPALYICRTKSLGALTVVSH
jgi:hypothetical protein